MSLSDARDKALKWKKWIAAGIDPREAEDAERKAAAAKEANTFTAFAEKYISERKNRRAALDAREIRRNLIPDWGNTPLHEITARDVRELITVLKNRSPYEARNAWTHAVQIFKLAVHEELLEASPCASLDKKLLFKGAKITHRQRVLNDDEVAALWRAAGKLGLRRARRPRHHWSRLGRAVSGRAPRACTLAC
jgi:hypothetical protein